MFKNIITYLVITILSLQINNCFGYGPKEDHEQLFADFFQAFKIQGNCPTVFVSSRKTELSRMLINKLSNSYGSCYAPSSSSTDGCDLKHHCANQIIDAIEPFANLDDYLSSVSVVGISQFCSAFPSFVQKCFNFIDLHQFD
jgi:hypothetical protein